MLIEMLRERDALLELRGLFHAIYLLDQDIRRVAAGLIAGD